MASVLADFDAGMKRVLALLDATDDQTLLISATFFPRDAHGGGVVRHTEPSFEVHAGDVLKVDAISKNLSGKIVVAS